MASVPNWVMESRTEAAVSLVQILILRRHSLQLLFSDFSQPNGFVKLLQSGITGTHVRDFKICC